MRRPLRRQLAKAWKTAIERHYDNGRINSEGSLQAAFWAQLSESLLSTRTRMFVEPQIKLEIQGKSETVRPDIVICNTRSVIAAVEIKYQPRKPPALIKDLRTLRLIEENRDRLTVTNSRYEGRKGDPRSYPFAEKTLYFWAGVHRPMSETMSLESLVPESLGGRFFALHAVTDANATPDTYSESL